MATTTARTADQPHKEKHHSNDQQDPDEVSKRVAADHPQQPQDNQDNRDSLEQVDLLLGKEPAECRFLLKDNSTLLLYMQVYR